MIESIRISGAATFGASPSLLVGLREFNYFYGANGSGKTTISRIIAEPGKYPSCTVTWKARTSLEPLVYNRDFIDKHFRASEELPGIFTLGEKDAQAADKIVKAKTELDAIVHDIANLNKTLGGDTGFGGKAAELAIVEDALRDACWEQKKKYDDTLKPAFKGFRDSAEKFKKNVLDERQTNKADKKAWPYIKEKAATVFAEGIARIEPLKTIDGASLTTCEQSPILAKKIIGKRDVDVAAMIQRLGNSDWVRTGRAFLAQNDQTCPFCQKPVAKTLEASLNAYFDESFEKDTMAVASLVTKYADDSAVVSATLEHILKDPPSLLDHVSLTAKQKLFDAHIEINKQRLNDKMKEPSRSIDLKSSQPLLDQITTIITAANDAIAEHNKTVANLAKEQTALKQQAWRFLLDDALKNDLATYDTKKSSLDKAITSLKKQIQEQQQAKQAKDAEIKALERSVTSIQPTIDAINALLGSFGFHGFSLAQADNKPCYKLRRPDGTDAKDTLSEGERTFVTFLYFYHLLKGSSSESGTTKDRVVVFDDPVSSLDSDILFIVSTLIRKLCDDVRNRSTTIKQVFVLTHNVYFHKEVTFEKKRGAGILNNETFWTVRKSKNQSEIVNHSSNPIKSSYELLWLNVRERRDDNLSIQNSLRRILESYFKMLGGIEIDHLHDQFTGAEKLACRSLVSWVNDGSHSAHDELFHAVDDSAVALYGEVFKKIFESQGHIEHYNMMMAVPPAVQSGT